MVRKLKTILLGIRNEFLREKAFSILINCRAFALRLLRQIRNNIYHKKLTSSTVYYSSTLLSEEIKTHNYGMDKTVDIDPFYFLEISLFNFVLQNYGYEACLELGSYRGETLNALSKNNPKVKFFGYDINPSIQDVNGVYEQENLKFFFEDGDYPDFSKFIGCKTLLITKAVFMYKTESELVKLFEAAKEAGLDIALAEPTRFQYNHHSRELAKNFNTGHKSYSHNYSLLLKSVGYNILYDSNMLNLGYYFPKDYKPYLLTLVCASVSHANRFMEPMEDQLQKLNRYL